MGGASIFRHALERHRCIWKRHRPDPRYGLR